MEKVRFVLLLLLMLPLSIKAQIVGNIPPYVSIEQLGDFRMNKPGTVSLSNYHEIGTIKENKFKDIIFQVVSVEDIQTKEVSFYGRFRYSAQAAGDGKVCIGSLTEAEIDKCLFLFSYAKDNLMNKDTEEIRQADFSNEVYNRFGIFKGEKEWRILVTTNYLQNNYQIVFSASYIDEFIAIFQAMKDKIASLK